MKGFLEIKNSNPDDSIGVGYIPVPSQGISMSSSKGWTPNRFPELMGFLRRQGEAAQPIMTTPINVVTDSSGYELLFLTPDGKIIGLDVYAAVYPQVGRWQRTIGRDGWVRGCALFPNEEFPDVCVCLRRGRTAYFIARLKLSTD